MRSNHFIYLLVFLFFSTVFSLRAAELPLDKQIDFFLKVLKFDRNVMDRPGDKIRVGIIYGGNNGTPSNLVSQIDDILYNKSVAEEKVGEKILTHSLLAFTSRANFEQQLKLFQISAFFIMPGNDSNVAEISDIAKQAGIITFTGVPQYVVDGIAVCVKDVDGKAKIIVNLPLAKEQGADLNANLLKMAEVLK